MSAGLNFGSNDVAGRTMMQPDSSVPGSAIVYAAAIYRPGKIFRSAELVSTGTPGVLEVHLLYDPADQWYLMELSPGVEKGRIFDAIRETNTTVTEADVTLFPCA